VNSESVPFRVWVVSCRPFVEKVVGGFVDTPDGTRPIEPVDGTFFLDRESAENLAGELNKSFPASWSVNEALVSILRREGV